jgi:hypothetical protein
MRKTEFIQKYLGNKNYQFTPENQQQMHDDLCAVVDYANALMQKESSHNLKVAIEDCHQELEKYPEWYENPFPFKTVKPDTDVVMIKDDPCCAYEQRTDGSRCWNCGDLPKKAPLPKDFVKLKYLLDMPSRNQNSDFSL